MQFMTVCILGIQRNNWSGFRCRNIRKHIADLGDKLIDVCNAKENANIESDRRRLKTRQDLLRVQLDKAVFDAYGISNDQAAQIKAIEDC